MMLPFSPLPTLFALTLAAAPAPQDAGATAQHAQAARRSVVEYYTPQKAPVETLAGTLSQLFHYTRPRQGLSPFLHPFGETLLVEAPADEIEYVMQLVAKCDANFVGEGERVDRIEEEWQHEVKHVSLDSLRSALHFLEKDPTTGGKGMRLSYVPERGLVIAQGSRADVEQAKSVASLIDVPSPQLLLRLYIVQGAEKSSEHLPSDLTRDLGALVPYPGFELLSSAFLPSDAKVRMSLQTDLEGERGRFILQMLPSAYDEKAGKLSLASIEFQLILMPEGEHNIERSFKTSTSLQAGQYTVLGAVGANPVFVVVKLERLGR